MARSQLFSMLQQLADLDLTPKGAALPGCWERKIGKWFIAVNSHALQKTCSRNVSVAPMHCYVEYARRPVVLFNAWGGTLPIDLRRATELPAVLRSALENRVNVLERRQQKRRVN